MLAEVSNGVNILTPTGVVDIKIKNPNFCSVFKSELIAIRRGCSSHMKPMFSSKTLTDNPDSSQHLSNWTFLGDMTSFDIFNLLDRISSNHCVNFQRVSSLVGIDGNEEADFLARTAAGERESPSGSLTF
ncbi:hypothetical protein TNCV_2026001 [Trichonephila clavipes]|nr:hypothetical protein TNCV_2026001 [Trichonephila clavipes]